MITRQEYLDALELIDKYHRQDQQPEKEKTKISVWLSNLPIKPSKRLGNILTGAYHEEYDLPHPFEYIEDVNRHEFMKLRNAGLKSWNEFVMLKNL